MGLPGDCASRTAQRKLRAKTKGTAAGDPFPFSSVAVYAERCKEEVRVEGYEGTAVGANPQTGTALNRLDYGPDNHRIPVATSALLFTGEANREWHTMKRMAHNEKNGTQ